MILPFGFWVLTKCLDLSEYYHGPYLWRVVRRGLDPEDDLVLEGVGVLVAGEEHVGVLEQLAADEVAEGLVLLVDGEDGGVGDLGVLLLGDLLLAVKQQERLECRGRVHLAEVETFCMLVRRTCRNPKTFRKLAVVVNVV